MKKSIIRVKCPRAKVKGGGGGGGAIAPPVPPPLERLYPQILASEVSLVN